MADDFADKSRAFKSWFLSHGGAFISPGIDLADYRSEGRGRGAVALADIPADTELFEIDPTSVLSVKTSDLFLRLPRDVQNDLAEKPWPSLILVLIYEYSKGDDSKWWPYLQLLPSAKDFDTLMYWTEDELNELQASAIRDKIGKADAEEMFAADVVPVIQKHADLFGVSHETTNADIISSCHRFASIIMSYAFDLENNEQKANADDDGYETDEEEGSQQKAMMPMADMLNADANYNAHIFNDEDGLKMRSTRNIKKGEEILNDFGAHPRSELLRRYGYITDAYQKYDVVEVPLSDVLAGVERPATLKEPEVNERLLFLKENGIASEGFVIDRGDPSDMKDDEDNELFAEIPEDMVEVMCHMLADSKVWKKWRKRLNEDEQGELRKVAHVHITGILQARLREYATDIDTDLALLKQTDTPHRKRMAIQVRLGEKQLLDEAQKEAATHQNQALVGNGEPPSKRQKTS